MDDLSSRESAHLADEKTFDLAHHLRVVRGRFWTILACGLVVLTLFAVYAFRATPIYEASARLLIERQLPRISPFLSGVEPQDLSSKESYRTKVKLITSKAVLERALTKERMADLFKREPRLDVRRSGLLGSVMKELRAIFGYSPSRPTEPWESLRDIVTVQPVSESDLVDIKVRGTHPEEAALISNAVTEAYVEYSVSTRKSGALEAFKMLQDQKREQEGALQRAEDDLQAYRESANLPHLGPPGSESPVDERLKTLNQQYTAIQLRRLEISVAADALRQAQEEGKSGDSLFSIDLIRNDPAVRGLHERLTQLQLDTQTALATYGEKHPRVTALEDQRRCLTSRLREAVSQLAGSVQQEKRMLEQREGELLQVLKQQNNLALELATTSHKYERLKRDVERQTRLFEVIVDRMKEIDLTKDAGITNVSLVERASMPRTPVKPNRQRLLVLGAVLGVLLGLAAAYFLEYLDDTIKTPDDVEKRLRIASLGYIPQMQTVAGEQDGVADRAMHSLLYPLSSTSESFRAIRTNIYFSGERGQTKSLLVTSAAPGEGKTLFAANLAVTMARDRKHVLLVDADLRRPSVHEAFGFDREPGLTNLLVEGTPLEALVHTPPEKDGTKLDNLHILCAGPKAPNPAELLGTDAMARFLIEARKKYDVVIYDSCPIPFLADNAVLSAGSDGTLLVLKAAKTRRDAAERSIKQLEAVKGRVIGGIVNAVAPKALRGYYSYYYYGYHRYYDEYYGEKDASRRDPARAAAADRELEKAA